MQTMAEYSAEACCAPAGRALAMDLEQQHSTLQMEEIVNALMQAMPGYVMVLNRQRQIVAVNHAVLSASISHDLDVLIGMRPGEALNCLHACEGPDGCGTGEHCSVCGAVQAIVNSQKTGRQDSRECRVVLGREAGVALDLQVIATPVVIHREAYTVLSLTDVSAVKRRELLERVFFHDVINTAGGIHGLASMLMEHSNLPGHLESEYKQWLVVLSGNLLEEIRAQRKLLEAERGEFIPELTEFEVAPLIDELITLYRHHERTPGRILMRGAVDECRITSDRSVVRRIVGNMIINALEATPPGGRVTLSVVCGDQVVFHVHNPGEIPRNVQLQLFNRSFSTKSVTGRGIGTYSMKLFGERYLNGSVNFTSSTGEGTTFSFSLPV